MPTGGTEAMRKSKAPKTSLLGPVAVQGVVEGLERVAHELLLGGELVLGRRRAVEQAATDTSKCSTASVMRPWPQHATP